MNPLQKLRNQRAALITKANELQAKADAESRDLTEAEATEHDQALDQAEALTADIKRRERAEAATTSLGEPTGRRSNPASGSPASATTRGADPSVKVLGEARDQDPNRGYRSHAEFLEDVRAYGTTGRMSDRLQGLGVSAAAGSDEQQEGDQAYGGFLLPEGFSPTLLQVRPEDAGLTLGTTKIPMATPIVRIPARVDKDHSTSVSGGLTVARRLETKAGSASRMQFEQVTLHAYSLFGAAYASEELLADSPISFSALIASGFQDEFNSRLIYEYLNGSGVGEFLGVNNSPCLITIAKEGSQAADTIVYENLIKARAQCYGYQNAVWLANPDCIPTLSAVKNPAGGTDTGIFHPSTGQDIPDMLLGRPITFSDHCETVGDAGDIMLGNWTQYLEGTLENLNQAASIHVRFLEHERTFKFWLRNAGAPWWRSALTPVNSAKQRSPFVRIAARA
jgi:HK97 family phage major capsid protein